MSELRPNQDDANGEENLELAETEQQQAAKLSAANDASKRAVRQVWLGLVWWMASMIIIALTLAFSQTIHLFFGGFILAVLYWIRSIQLFREAKKGGAPEVKFYKRWQILLTMALVIFTSATVPTEYIHVMNPGVGTCWNTDENGSLPVACFSPLAQDRAVALVSNLDNCPADTQNYFDPDATEKNYTCLVPAH